MDFPLKCVRCGYTWYPRQGKIPKSCPNRDCRSLSWNKPKLPKVVDPIAEEKRRLRRVDYGRQYYHDHKNMWNKRTPEKQSLYNANRRETYASNPDYNAKLRAKVKEYQESHPHMRKAQRLRKYGITVDEFNTLFEHQGGKCAVCGYSDMTQKKMFPHVDHDHETGKVRGLLCSNCNMAIGKMKDSPELLLKAAEYIKSGGVI
jgi:hypothetical protein